MFNKNRVCCGNVLNFCSSHSYDPKNTIERFEDAGGVSHVVEHTPLEVGLIYPIVGR